MNPSAPVTEPPPSTPTSGERLQAARAARGWSVQHVATRLRIRPALVEALERGNSEPFGAAAYARGQLRNYARLLGLDEHALLAGFDAPTVASKSRLMRRAPELHPRRPWLVRLGGLAIVGVLVVLGALWAGADRSPQAPPPENTAEPAGQPAAQAPVEPVPSPPESAPPTTAAAPSVDVAPVVGAPAASSPAEAVPLSAPGAEPVTTSASEPAATSSPPAPATAGAELRLRSRAVSWVEVTDHRGQRLIYELVGPERERVVSGEPPLRVLLGNAPAVDVVFAGQAVTLPPGQHVVRMTLGTAQPPADAPAGAPAAMPTP
ncbi:MAG: RodZ domain-containing protein [Immundisolibacter sp.]|uniref:RodZ domain-containing protein n=1 Tax=Immundisolibacter sp. TaxID=1934948 RepID=UPI003D0C9CD7